MSRTLQIALVDDHALFRESVARLLALEPGLEIAGVCASLESARALLRAVPVDVVLLDYDLGGEAGGELLPSLQALAPEARTLMVTGGISGPVLRRLLEAGASGVVLKNSSPRELVAAIHVVARGGTWWDDAPLMAAGSAATTETAFTERQRRVLTLLLDGLSNKELATQLNVSEPAIKATLQELFRKCGVRTRSQLVRIALETSAAEEAL